MISNGRLDEALFLSWVDEVEKTMPLDYRFQDTVFCTIKSADPYLYQLSELGKIKARTLPNLYLLSLHKLQICSLPGFFELIYPIKDETALFREALDKYQIPLELKSKVYNLMQETVMHEKRFVSSKVKVNEDRFLNLFLYRVHNYSIENYRNMNVAFSKNKFIELMRDNDTNVKDMSNLGKNKICAIFHMMIKTQQCWELLRNLKSSPGFQNLIEKLKDTPNGKIVLNEQKSWCF